MLHALLPDDQHTIKLRAHDTAAAAVVGRNAGYIVYSSTKNTE